MVPRLSIVGATKVTAGFSGSAATVCGMAIYPDTDGATNLALASDVCPSSAGTLTYTVSAFTLSSNTPYRFCVCTTNGQTYLGQLDVGGTKNGTALLNTFTTTRMGSKTSGCTVGVPDSTAPALTTDTSHLVPMLVIE